MADILSFRAFGAEGVADPDGCFDFGFGDEPPPGWDPAADPLDLGFGDEPLGLDMPVILIPNSPVLSTVGPMPDDGGVVLELAGDFKAWPRYKVRIKNSFTAETFPDSPIPGCLSVRPGDGYQITPEVSKKALRFALPALPPAVYDILVYFGPNYAMSLPTVANAFRVIRRHWTQEQYTMRALPEHWVGTGPRALRMEDKLGGV